MEDEYEIDRLARKVSMVGWLYRNGRATCRPACSCCGGSQGVRRAWRKLDRHSEDWLNENACRWRTPSKGHKPRYKDRRCKRDVLRKECY